MERFLGDIVRITLITKNRDFLAIWIESREPHTYAPRRGYDNVFGLDWENHDDPHVYGGITNVVRGSIVTSVYYTIGFYGV